MHDEYDGGPQTPAGGCDLPLPDASDTAGDRDWGALRQASFADFKEAVAEGDTARSVLLVNVLAELALLDLGTIRAGSRRGQRALRAARLALARRLIARHLPQPELSAAMVAGLIGVSVRHLHMLFERTGQSFAKTVNAQRIRRSGQLLCEMPERPVADIASACGFASPATFYRLFHAAMGMPPSRFRPRGAAADLADKAADSG